jgi:hypothetical protein
MAIGDNSFVWDQNPCVNSIGSIVIYDGRAITRDSVICCAFISDLRESTLIELSVRTPFA